MRDYKEIWFCDFEYSINAELLPVPVCLVAYELHTKQEIRIWLEENAPTNVPFNVKDDALYVCFQATAEMSVHLALGWEIPKNILDLRIEYLNITNGLREKKGSTKLVGVLERFHINHSFELEKEDLQQRIIRGGPFSSEERETILDYCAQDVYVLEKLYLKMVEHIHLPQALLRGRYMYSLAVVERNGIPLDMEIVPHLKEHWEEIKLRMIQELDEWGIYEGTTFKHDRFAGFLINEGLIYDWKRTKKSGRLSTSEDMFKDMAEIHPQLKPLYQLKMITGKLRKFKLKIGADGRNRAYLNPLGTVTGRNAPSSTEFLFGSPKFLRGLAKPSQGNVLIYADYSSQEYAVAAVKSNDRRKIHDYMMGDPYTALGKSAGDIPPDGTKQTHPEERSLYKVASLGVLYGLSVYGLGRRFGDLEKAKRILTAHKKAYPIFWRWIEGYCSIATIRGKVVSKLGWTRKLKRDENMNSIKNHPMQSAGADMTLLVVTLLVEAGIKIIAPLHDGFFIEAPEEEAEEVASQVVEIMKKASRIVLDGFEIRVDVEVFKDRYMDEDGKEMWHRVVRILEFIKQEKVEKSPGQRDLIHLLVSKGGEPDE